jgi:hypothetical protein
MLGVNTHILDHLDTVDTSARAAAVAATAIQNYQTGQQRTGDLFMGHRPLEPPSNSRILKVFGFIEPLDAYKLKETERVEIEEDMRTEFNKLSPVTY